MTDPTYGAIIGDIAGSIYEWNNHYDKDIPLLQKGCTFTDDTIMTLAIAQGIMDGATQQDFIHALQDIGQHYPHCGYGGHFIQWMFDNAPQPYNSCGNGAAMRISPTAGMDEQTKINATTITHNHPEGIKGALATTHAIELAAQKKPKQEIKDILQNTYHYDLDRTVDQLRPWPFNETCQKTVPEAILCFLESNSFPDAIKTAISIGGDSDTIAAITGSIAAAYYGIDNTLKQQARQYLDKRLQNILDKWEQYNQATQ